LIAGDRSSPSRWQDHHAAQRISIVISDLIDAENQRARLITGAVEARDFARANQLAENQGAITAINVLLKESNLPITISIEAGNQISASKYGGDKFSFEQLSDGERNAILVVGMVLTGKPGTLFLVDEPERHLHRSIISPLLTSLFDKRTDPSQP
jgi:hypothetical protein